MLHVYQNRCAFVQYKDGLDPRITFKIITLFSSERASGSDAIEWQIKVETYDSFYCGTSGPVYMTVTGDNGTSEAVHLGSKIFFFRFNVGSILYDTIYRGK